MKIRPLNIIQYAKFAIFKSIFKIFVFALLAKSIGFVKEILIAYNYGISRELDAFVFVNQMFLWPISVFMAVTSSVLVPELVRLKADRQRFADFSSSFLSRTVLAAVLISVTVGLFVTYGSTVMVGAGKGDLLGLVRQIAPPMACIILFECVSHYGSALLMSRERHTNTLFDGIPAFTIAIVLIISSAPTLWHLVAAYIAGALLRLIVTAATVHYYGLGALPTLERQSDVWSKLRGPLVIMAVAQLIQTLHGVIDRVVAARLDPGSVAVLGYSTSLSSLINTLGAMVLARSLLPVLSSVRYDQGLGAAHSMTIRWAGGAFLVGLVATLLAYALAPAAVGFVYERGAFLPEDTARVVGLFRIDVLHVPFFFANICLAQGVHAMQRQRLLLILATSNIITKIIGLSFFLKDFGLQGIAWSNVLMYAVSVVILWVLLQRLNNNTKNT